MYWVRALKRTYEYTGPRIDHPPCFGQMGAVTERRRSDTVRRPRFGLDSSIVQLNESSTIVPKAGQAGE